MSDSNDQTEYNVTVEQAMEILGCSRRTVYRKIKKGDIRAENAGLKSKLEEAKQKGLLNKVKGFLQGERTEKAAKDKHLS